MKNFIVLLFILSLSACTIIEDDTKNVCRADCTTLKGRFVTKNNVGIKGVKVVLRYINPGATLGIGGSTRIIVKTKTDKNGDFQKDFYIKDKELGAGAEGYFIIEYDDTHLNVQEYILSDNRIGISTSPLTQTIFSIQSRDTILGNTYYLPKKSHIKVNLNNFIPIQEGDYFEVMTYYPFGPKIGKNENLNTEYAIGFSPWDAFTAKELQSQLYPFVAENEENIIIVYNKKNGVLKREEVLIFIPENNSIELSYDY